VDVRARVPGLDPAEFWALPLAHERVLAMRDKYEAELALARLPHDSPQQREAIRELARRWPGSLREAELIGPQRAEARRAAAAAGCTRAHESGATWWARGDADRAVLAWAHLHAAIAELLVLRRRGGSLHALDWPGLAQLPDLRARKLDVRVAYLWLAARAGLSLPALGLVLFARSGHWDARPGDPAWASEPEA
jgi:hypothetical protein